MNIEPITLAIGGLLTAAAPALGAFVYARNQWQASNRSDDDQVIDAVEKARQAEKEDCGKHLARIEKRLDGCEKQHAIRDELFAELASLVGAPSLARRARSLSPPSFPAVKPEEEKP